MYSGQKNIPGVIHKIINQIPEFTDFYEPYCGSAAVSSFLSVRDLSKNFFLNDLDDIAQSFITVLQGMSFSSVPAIKVIQSLRSVPPGSGTFVFIDPPYLHETRPNQTNLYRFEMSQEDHEELLLSVLELKCNCMIIHPVCTLYENALSGFRKVRLNIRYNRKTSLECLYMNYPEVQSLANYSLLGSDCWDRQRIKRKSFRTIQKFMALPPAERNYILNDLKKNFNL
jgi:DNA adenine methylase